MKECINSEGQYVYEKSLLISHLWLIGLFLPIFHFLGQTIYNGHFGLSKKWLSISSFKWFTLTHLYLYTYLRRAPPMRSGVFFLIPLMLGLAKWLALVSEMFVNRDLKCTCVVQSVHQLLTMGRTFPMYSLVQGGWGTEGAVQSTHSLGLSPTDLQLKQSLPA